MSFPLLLHTTTEPDGGRKWLMAFAPIGAKGIYIYILHTTIQ